jgi:zinc transporter, ZIP family
MLAAATLGLLAEALEGVRGPNGTSFSGLMLITGGFLSGVLVAVAMDRLIPHGHARGHHAHISHDVGHDHDHHHGEHEHPPSRSRSLYLLLGAISIHRFPEGLAIGAGFAAPESNLGWLLSAAVALQNVCEGMVMGAPLRQAGLSPARTLVLVSATGLMVPVGAVFGYGLSGLAVVALPFILALAGGTLIFVTSNEIIPESHSHGYERTASAGLVVGFLLTMLLGAVLR